jgi:multidrug transporter EmrE-like cation transporter
MAASGSKFTIGTVTQAFLYVIYSLLNTSAIVLIKEARGSLVARHGPGLVLRLGVAVAVYAGALATLVTLLRMSDASIALPIAIGCTVVATNTAGAMLYGERMTGRKMLGMVLVMGGIALTFFDAGRT